MTFYDETLKTLQENIARFHRINAMLNELQTQETALEARVRELEAVMLDEQADVERFEGRSLSVFYYKVIGKLDDQLSKEREEAYAARVKYDAAAEELKGVQADIRQCKSDLIVLYGCEAKYEAALRKKADAVKAAGGEHAEEILKLEERHALLENQIKELREAISAGNTAHTTARHVLDRLGSAESWGTWDLLGGGLLADAVKYSHLDEAQSAVERLQSQLRRFKTELADVTIHADMQVNVDGFLRFADYFFDGLFADLAVMDKISQSRSQVQSTKNQIEKVLSRLNSMINAAEQEQVQIKNKLDALVLEAQL